MSTALTSAQRCVIASVLRDTHDVPWADAMRYADTIAEALDHLEQLADCVRPAASW